MEKLDIIDSEKRLIALCENLKRCDWVALDTEFIREKTYFSKLCLVQVASANTVACIDALALRSLAPLIDVLRETRSTKVFHAAYQDLEIFFQLCGTIPRPIFDTQIAASLLGHGDQIGYAALVDKVLGTTLEKAHTRTNWSLRPLAQRQLRYAADDVRYLGQLYLEFLNKLVDKNRLDWLYEETEKLFNERVFNVSLDDIWKRVRGLNNLSSRQLAVLQALAAWREVRAARKNRPRRWILSDIVLVNLARRSPEDLASLAKTPGVSRKLYKRHGESLTDTIRMALRTPPDCWPVRHKHQPPSRNQEALTELMVTLVSQHASKLNISPNMLASRGQLLRLSRGMDDALLTKGWRSDIIGKPLQDLISEWKDKKIY